MALQMTGSDDDAQIRGLLDDWVKAARAKDIDGIMATYAPDILAFDAIAQLQFKGAAGIPQTLGSMHRDVPGTDVLRDPPPRRHGAG